MQHYIKKALPIIIAGLMLVFFSCKRNDEGIKGPGIISAPEGFEVLSFNTSHTNADFEEDTVTFNGSFSDAASWKLTIEGGNSGAVREFRGVGNGIDAADAKWQGRHDGVYFFRQGEEAIATLSFFGTDYTAKDTIIVDSTRNYQEYGYFLPAGDFEDPDQVSYPDWVEFGQPNSDRGIASSIQTIGGEVVPSVQGENYFYIRDMPAHEGQFVEGLRRDNVDASPLSNIPDKPDNVWVNIYVYGTGNDNTQLNFEFHEADEGDGTPGHQPTQDDGMVAQISGGHEGWQLFSFKYSNLDPSGSAEFGGSGNGIHEPHRLRRIQFGLLKSNDNSARAEVYFDFPIITVGGPFDPTK